MGAAWLAGVAINLVGSIMINLGTNIMKMGHNKLALLSASAGPGRPLVAIYKIREWQVGVTLFSAGNVANFVSFGYAAQSLLAAIGCVQFVSNVIFASLVLKEQVSRGVLAATALIIGGCVLLVSGGSHSSAKYTYRQLLALYHAPAYMAYLSVGGAAVVASYAAYWVGQKAVMTKGPRAARAWNASLPVLYSVFSALIGTQSVLFSKTLAVLLRSTAGGENQLGKWFTWFVLLAFLASAIFWVTRLNKGLRMFPALVIVPSLQICWTLFSIVSGMLYFQEYAGMRGGPTALFVVGVAVVFGGVFLLTRASQQASGPTRAASPDGTATTTKAAAATAPGGPVAAGPAALQKARAGTEAAANGSGRDSNTWELAAVRAPVAPPPMDPTGDDSGPLGLRLAAQASAAAQHRQRAYLYNEEDEDDSNEEEALYERALLSATSLDSASFQLPPAASHAGLSPLSVAQAAAGEINAAASASAAAAASMTPGGRGADAAAGGASGLASSAQGPGMPGGAKPRHRKGAKRWLAKASSLKRRVAADFSLDEAAAARLALGLGSADTPGFSLFAMPVMALSGTAAAAGQQQQQQQQHLQGGSDGPLRGAGGARMYGRLPESSLGGGGGGGSWDGGGNGCLSAAGAAAVHCMRPSESGQSFLHPPPRSSPSSMADAAAAAPPAFGAGGSLELQQQRLVGPVQGINPLANAIDIRSLPSSAKGTPAGLTPQGSGVHPDDAAQQQQQQQHGVLDGSSPRAHAAWTKLRAVVSLTAALGGSGGGAERSYERMTSQEGAGGAGAGGGAAEASGGRRRRSDSTSSG